MKLPPYVWILENHCDLSEHDKMIVRPLLARMDEAHNKGIFFFITNSTDAKLFEMFREKTNWATLIPTIKLSASDVVIMKTAMLMTQHFLTMIKRQREVSPESLHRRFNI